MSYTVLSDNDAALQELFLRLPKLLYDRKTRMQDEKTERAVLQGRHLLSPDFTVYPFVVTDGKRPVSRALLTVYPDDPTAYFGYFESENSPEAVRLLFSALEDKAQSLGVKTLSGPVNASFWIGYRLKTDAFSDAPFTGEPYSLPYYEELLSDEGFRVSDRYVSDLYRPVPKDYQNARLARRKKQFQERGITVRDLQLNRFNETMAEIFGLLTKLYADFPAFRPIDQDRFSTMFSDYRRIVRPELVKLAYDEDKLVGFFICVPDFGNRVYRAMTPWNILSILRARKHPKRCILLYLGCEPEYLGLGAELVYEVLLELQKNEAEPVGALIHEGKVTQNYARDLLMGTHGYALYRKELSHSGAGIR